MQSKLNEVEKLDSQCLKRICRDLVRHSVKCLSEKNAEASDYFNFQRMFSDKLLSVLCAVSNESCLNSSTALFIDCINFVFNPFLVKICIPDAVDFSEEIASAISANCKKMYHLSLPHKMLTSDICDFFNLMRNLVILDLSCSLFESESPMKAIGDSLVNLKVLDLSRTNIDDHGLYILCGHDKCPSTELTCSFIKTCDADCKLQLKYLNLLQTTVGKESIACLLTHIPTLRRIPSEVSLSQVITEISAHRQNFEMPVQRFQLRTINCLKNPEELRECLEACPQLRDLSVKYTSHIQSQMDEVLAKVELERLQFVSFGCTSLDLIFSEKLKYFWEKWGPQISFLCVYGIPPDGHITGNLNAIGRVLSSCPNLKGLYLSCFIVRSLRLETCEQFPELPEVQFLVLEMAGNPDLVNRVACRFIHSTPNVTQLTLKFLIRD